MDTVQSQYLGKLNAIVTAQAALASQFADILQYLQPVAASMPDSEAKLQAAQAANQTQHDILAELAQQQSEIAAQ